MAEGLKFIITGDESQYLQALDRVERATQQTAQTLTGLGAGMQQPFQDAARASQDAASSLTSSSQQAAGALQAEGEAAKEAGQANKAAAEATTEAANKAKEAGKSLWETAKEMDSSLARLAKGAGALFAVQQARDFVGQVVAVRSQIESMETAFEVFLGSQERSAAVMKTLQEVAASSPLTLDALGAGMQTLLGFNIEGDKALTVLRQIGDISGGDAEKLKSLSLAFAQASSTGRLMGQDLLN